MVYGAQETNFVVTLYFLGLFLSSLLLCAAPPSPGFLFLNFNTFYLEFIRLALFYPIYKFDLWETTLLYI